MTQSDPVAALTQAVLFNLEFQHHWTNLEVHDGPGSPRPVISGLPPRRLYMHPDEQIEIIKAEKVKGAPIPQPPEYEWVLPTHLAEKWTVSAFAEVFDSLSSVPPATGRQLLDLSESENERWKEWRGPRRGKRVLLATIQDDSTIVYYLMHDGIVKPRQN